jgi:uncharacterized membrane protein YpjA
MRLELRDLLNRHLWTMPFVLWSLFWVNLLGTVYGYIWYAQTGQLGYTFEFHPAWVIPFVPDSPTASLFFTLSLAYLLWDKYAKRSSENSKQQPSLLRSFIVVFGAVTSFKYGIWAVTMIFAGAYQGSAMEWTDWMLVISHLGMAVEGVIFIRFFRLIPSAFVLVTSWILLNDLMDYHGYTVYPWLPNVLKDDLGIIEIFTLMLSIVSVWMIWFANRKWKV